MGHSLTIVCGQVGERTERAGEFPRYIIRRFCKQPPHKKIEPRPNSIGNENVKEFEPMTISKLGSVDRIHSKYLITNHRLPDQYELRINLIASKSSRKLGKQCCIQDCTAKIKSPTSTICTGVQKANAARQKLCRLQHGRRASLVYTFRCIPITNTMRVEL